MFSKTIIDSDAFLDMPTSAQSLYFHLAMRADDDGFVGSPRKIQRMVGASEDDLRILVAKRFIIAFESGIVVIKHWRIHNYIQADRYKETNYIKEKSQLAIEKNNAYTEKIQDVSILDTRCIQDVSSSETQDRLDKDRISKDRIEDCAEEVAVEEEPKRIPYQKIQEMFNVICKDLPSIRGIEGKRRVAVTARWNDCQDLEVFRTLFTKTAESTFLNGGGSQGFKADFDWLMIAGNFNKVLEGKYDNREEPKPQQKPKRENELSDDFIDDWVKLAEERGMRYAGTK